VKNTHSPFSLPLLGQRRALITVSIQLAVDYELNRISSARTLQRWPIATLREADELASRQPAQLVCCNGCISILLLFITNTRKKSPY
jgi:hypothetical protein